MSVIYFDGEEIPEGHRIWDPLPPLGTRGFQLCSQERIFQLCGTHQETSTGLRSTHKERCGVETYFIIVDPPIKFLRIDSVRLTEEYCRECQCKVRGGVQYTRDDPRYEHVVQLLLSYIVTENDIDFYR